MIYRFPPVCLYQYETTRLYVFQRCKLTATVSRNTKFNNMMIMTVRHPDLGLILCQKVKGHAAQNVLSIHLALTPFVDIR